jgi:hypothetical protein
MTTPLASSGLLQAMRAKTGPPTNLDPGRVGDAGDGGRAARTHRGRVLKLSEHLVGDRFGARSEHDADGSRFDHRWGCRLAPVIRSRLTR